MEREHGYPLGVGQPGRQSRRMEREHACGIVELWHDEEGWGAVRVDDDGESRQVFVHFSHIEMRGYRWLDVGERVAVTFVPVPAQQDGYDWVATLVRPVDR